MYAFIFAGLFFGILFGVVLGREAVPWGLCVLVFGIGPLFCMGMYEIFFNKTTEPSEAGMVAVIILLCFTPFALTLIVVGWLRGDLGKPPQRDKPAP